MTAARTASRRLKGKRTEIETDLVDTYSVDYQFLTKVPAGDFDIDKSLANQARFEALHEETVEVYKEALERGDAFPAVIAWRPGRGANPKLVIIDGNHRRSRMNAPGCRWMSTRSTAPPTRRRSDS